MAKVNVPAPGDGPIPGENFTSDTRNYPWHRAPEYDDMDDAIEAAFNKLATKEGAHSLLTALQSGISVVEYTSMLVISGIGAGKWTPDFALLLAGPVSHIIKILADGYGLEYEMGLEDEVRPTAALYKEMTVLDTGKVSKAIAQVEDQLDDVMAMAEDQEGVEEDTPKLSGFMKPVLDDEESL